MVRWFVSCIESVVAQRATSVHGRAGGQLIAHACSYIRVPRCVDRCQRKEMRKKKEKSANSKRKYEAYKEACRFEVKTGWRERSLVTRLSAVRYHRFTLVSRSFDIFATWNPSNGPERHYTKLIHIFATPSKCNTRCIQYARQVRIEQRSC